MAPESLWDLPQMPVKIRSEVCPHGRRWSSRLRGEGGEGEESGRLYQCVRCRRQVVICRCCDRGQRYCAGECAAAARREAQRASSRRYQQSKQGRRRHAQRQGRYRARGPRAEKKVTHQGGEAMGESETRAVEKTAAAKTPSDAKEVPDVPDVPEEQPEKNRANTRGEAEGAAKQHPDEERREVRCCDFCGRSCGEWLRRVPLSKRPRPEQAAAQARGDP